MEGIEFNNQESLFYFISKIISLAQSDPNLISLISDFWRQAPNPRHKDFIQIENSFNMAKNFFQKFQFFVQNSLNIQISPISPVSPQLLNSDSPDPDRIYMDGCFDLMHSGHYNAIRQAKSLGKILVVGVHSDQQITRNKGPPVMNEQERYALVRACKWVDEVVQNAPYSPTIELLDSLNCLCAAHGDDLSINEQGSDCMSILKRAGRCKIFKRTQGISTTQIVGKLLLMTRDAYETIDQPKVSSDIVGYKQKHLLTTSRRISEFSNKLPAKTQDFIVYIDGTFDLFHIGHIETIKKAKELGTYLMVGVHDDQTVNKYKGSNFPIMSLHDRVMCVLSTKYVNQVVIGAPWVISQDLLTAFNIKLVVQGTIRKGDPDSLRWRKGSVDVSDQDPYRVPKEMGIYYEIDSTNTMDTQDIIERIVSNRLRFFSKFERTSEREAKYNETKEYIGEV